MIIGFWKQITKVKDTYEREVFILLIKSQNAEKPTHKT